MRRFQDWPIAARIATSVAIPLLIGMAIGVKGLVSLRSVGESAERSAAAAQMAVEAGQAHAAFLELKVAVREYVARNSAERFRSAERVYRDALARVRSAEDRAALEAYWRGFAAIAELRAEANTLRDERLRANGTAMRQGVQAASWQGADAALPRLLLMRAYADRFIETRGPEEAARVRQEALALADLLAAAGPAAGPIRERLADFQAAFARWQEVGGRIAELDRSAIQVEGNRIVAALQEAEQRAQSDAVAATDAARREIAAAILLSLGAIGVALLVGLLATWIVVRSVVRPLAATTREMRALAEGGLETEVTGAGRRDEIGAMAQALGVFKANMEARRRAEEETEAIRVATTRRQEEMDQLTGLFGRSVGGVFQRVGQSCQTMRTTAADMAAGARSTAGEATTIRVAADGALGGIQTVSAAAEQLAASVREISSQAAYAARSARECVGEAESATSVAGALTEATRRIEDVVRVIAEVASRTHLLALNATIEAARAGEAGKGFAVVASEVKALATQTAQATGDIGEQIAAMQREVQRTVGTIEGIARKIGAMNESAVAVAAAVEEQGAATAEIARTVDGLLAETHRVSAAVGGMESTAMQTGQGAKDVADRATELSAEAETLAREVTEFLSALAGTKTGERFRAYAADLPAELQQGARSLQVRIRRITSGSVVIDVSLDAQPGEQLVLRIAGIGRPIAARYAGAADPGSYLQLPMDLAHVDWVEGEIRQLGLQPAA